MSPASYQTAPPRDVCRCDRPFLELPACLGPARGPAAVCLRAGNGTRTRDPNLGKVVLYQLSYSRKLLVTTATQVEVRGIEPLTS